MYREREVERERDRERQREREVDIIGTHMTCARASQTAGGASHEEPLRVAALECRVGAVEVSTAAPHSHSNSKSNSNSISSVSSKNNMNNINTNTTNDTNTVHNSAGRTLRAHVFRLGNRQPADVSKSTCVNLLNL